MAEIPWEPDPYYTSATRAERASIGDYEVIVLDLPPGLHFQRSISWELFGPPFRARLIEWGENCATFEDAKARAAEALARVAEQQ